MKKIAKITGGFLLLLIVVLLIAGLLFPKGYHYEHSVTIHAPKEIIWKNISTFNNFMKWNPWDTDPQMQRSIEGIDGTVGATYSWKGNKEVGAGSMTYRSFRPMELVAIDARFKEPYASTANMVHMLQDGINNYQVTWIFESEMPYPLNAVVRLVIQPDRYLADDFNRGLEQLKKICESESANTTADASRL